jgi:tetratricopeptide (TPR) repeat protein
VLRFAFLIPLALVWAAFSPTLRAGFVHDDVLQILGNPLLRDPARLPEIWTSGVWAGAGSASSWYRPLLMSSFLLEHALHGFSPIAMHAAQLALYSACVYLALRLVHALEGSAQSVLCVGLLFGLHPVNVEPAAWLSGRMDLLSTAGGLGALLLHRRGLHAAAATALTLGLFGKENAVGFLPAFLALDHVLGASFRPRALLRRYGPLLAGLALYAALRTRALGDPVAGLAAVPDPGLLLGAVGQGLARILWPLRLGIAPPAPTSLHAWLGVGVLVGLAAASVVAVRRRSVALVPLAIAGTQIAVAALAAARLGELADRYLLGAVFGLAWLAVRTLALPATACAGVALLLGVASWLHAGVFRSNLALWSNAVGQNPRSAVAVLNLAAAYLDAGQPRAALEWLDRADALPADADQLAINRAVVAQQLGRPAEARRILEALLARSPADPRAHLRLGHLALDRGAPDEAKHHYAATLAVLPLSAEAWAGMGVARYELGEYEPARAALERALRLDPQVQNADALRELLRRPEPLW